MLFDVDEEQKMIEEELRIKAKQEALLQAKAKKIRPRVSVKKTVPATAVKPKQPADSKLGFARAMAPKKTPKSVAHPEVKQMIVSNGNFISV